jgi:divinyl protochlorophyllide a 8-vinyl-reductase
MGVRGTANAARIGPNAIIQMAAALEHALGRAPTERLMDSAGVGPYLDAPPAHMVDEREVIALHSAVREQLPLTRARDVAIAAGVATGDYLLANRIPRLAQRLLRNLPAPLASRGLLEAITQHAWTFAGSGQFDARPGHPVIIAIGNRAICRGARAAGPCCEYYSATFTRLFAELVHPSAIAREAACIAAGAAACRFEIRWRP